MQDIFNVSPQLLIKLASIIVHYEEFVSKDGDQLDLATIESLMSDKEVNNWFDEMRRESLLPLKRNE